MSGPLDAYPLLLQPRLHRRLWGGSRLAAWIGDTGLPVSGPADEPVGEAWLVGADNLVTNGAYRGVSLGALAATYGAALVGEAPFARYGAVVPLLAKLLDAREDLSIQVHPDDAYARREHPGSGHLGKAEAWYVLEAAPGAGVLRGFTRATEPAALRAAALDGTLPSLMRRLPVVPGSVVVNPAGTVHAVGAGCLLFEIQQASDLTYRLFDYGRRGADGAPRELHLDRALAVADLSGGGEQGAAPRPSSSGWTRLVQLPEFSLDARAMAGGAPLAGTTSAASFEILFVAAGEATVAGGGVAAGLVAGGAAVLPAGLGAYTLRGEGTILRCLAGAGRSA